MASPWPQRADDARLEVMAILKRIAELCKQQELAHRHGDDDRQAILRHEIYVRSVRADQILAAARRGEYAEVYKGEEEG